MTTYRTPESVIEDWLPPTERLRLQDALYAEAGAVILGHHTLVAISMGATALAAIGGFLIGYFS